MTPLHQANLKVLRRFVKKNALQDNHSNIHFKCRFDIKVPYDSANIICEARITFDEYDNSGIVSVIDFEIEEYQFPTQFWARYNKMTSVLDKLTIIDKHPTIGKYKAVITAISKVGKDIV